jgi:BirA family biotin operon repressor/biotin-[acetyl-CoA-carboxylase] ligase
VPDQAASFDLATVDRALANTRFAAKLRHFPTIGSTNLHAVEAANNGAPDGHVYIADEQTAGRGRGGHTWHSTAGDGLYVSVIVRPAMDLAQALWISLSTGLAVQRAIHETTGLTPDIRWPNDILLNTLKAGGILVETASTHTAKLKYAVIGIGINVNHAAFPAELESLATSLLRETSATTSHPQPSKKISRETLLYHLILALDDEIRALESELSGQSAPSLLARFTQASTWVRGKRVRVDESGGYTGLTAGLDERGFLLVNGDDGILHTVLSGGVRPE